MKIEITSTETLTNIHGVSVRVWDGVTEGGVRCKVLVHRIAVADDEFDRELKEQLPPGRFVPRSRVL